MARKTKEILDKDGNDVRDLGYYFTPKQVSTFIQTSMLEINPKLKTVLDPAVGKEELIDIFIEKNISVESFDIVKLKREYSSRFNNIDFIEYIMENFSNDVFGSKQLCHDGVIMNPPYNCHKLDYIKLNKQRLTNHFKDTKALNMYSMFMDAVISNSKEGAVLGMIVSDSFMTNKMHKALRDKIRNNCKIHKLIMCPTDLFWSQKADVRTTILILEKTKDKSEKDVTQVLQRLNSVDEFSIALERKKFLHCHEHDLFLSHERDNNEIIVDVPPELRQLFTNQRIGDVYPCITGISTGNDKKYLSIEKSEKYPFPFYKNPGSNKFKSEPQNYLVKNFLEISKTEKTFMVRNKNYIGQKGITCSSMGVKFSACELPEGSAFGVNPNIFPPVNDIGWLCCYLNSSLVQYLLRGVIVRSNMVTSGYVSRIPLVELSENVKDDMTNIHNRVMDDSLSVVEAISLIDQMIYKNCNFNKKSTDTIKTFCANLYRST